MAILTDLPAELLEQVFHCLGSIDDVHHFGRACRTTYWVIRRAPVYVEIMRSVIHQSPSHRYDIQLCRMLELHDDIVQHFCSSGTPIVPTQVDPRGMSYTTLNHWEDRLQHAVTDKDYLYNSKFLTDTRIYTILARWQGLRVLQTLWLVRQLNCHDYLAVDDATDADDFVHLYDIVQERAQNFDDRESLARSTSPPEAEFYTNFNADQKGRFYAAVTRLWLMNEIRWVLTNFAYPYPTFAVPLTVLDECMNRLAEQTETPLLDELELLAVYQFLYHHLLTLYSPALADQSSSRLPFTVPSAPEKAPLFYTRILQLFLMAGQTYFQPPDIIDLVVRNKLGRQRPYITPNLPGSTEMYIRPGNRHLIFLHNIDLSSPRHEIDHLSTTSLELLSLIQRSTVTQFSHGPAPQLQNVPLSYMFNQADLLNHWLMERALVKFDMYTPTDQSDIREVFTERWDDTKWLIWWWAGSEDQARMKMERWRQDDE